MMAANICIYYQYRDAANYKQHGCVVLANPTNVAPEELRAALVRAFPRLQSFPDIVAFDPLVLGWRCLYLEGHDLEGPDVASHEVEAIELSGEAPNVEGNAEDLLVRLSQLAGP